MYKVEVKMMRRKERIERERTVEERERENIKYT